jgi:hypothetical protein
MLAVPQLQHGDASAARRVPRWARSTLDSRRHAAGDEGVVSEVTPSGLITLEGVRVYCETCGVETHHSAYTDANGFYSFKGLYYQEFAIWVSKDGYVDPAGMELNKVFPVGRGWRDVKISGDNTQFDMQLAHK